MKSRNSVAPDGQFNNEKNLLVPLNPRKAWELVTPGTSEELRDGNEDPEDWLKVRIRSQKNLLSRLPNYT